MRFDLRVAFVAAVTILAAAPAFAHAQLLSATPGVGRTIQAAPSSITLSFSEPVEPAFCGVSVVDGAGKAVGLVKPVAGASKSTLVVGVEGKLAAGDYTVVWHVVSVDTHRTQGKFTFTIAP